MQPENRNRSSWSLIKQLESRKIYRPSEKRYINTSYYLYRCTCGYEVETNGSDIRSGKSKMCKSCSSKQNNTQRKEMTNTGLYTSFRAMKQRVYAKPGTQDYKWYTGKGIKLCSAWHDWDTFREWAISNGWKEGLTIDRIDSDGDYCPSNCRWLSRSDNARLGNRGQTKITKECVVCSEEFICTSRNKSGKCRKCMKHILRYCTKCNEGFYVCSPVVKELKCKLCR